MLQRSCLPRRVAACARAVPLLNGGVPPLCSSTHAYAHTAVTVQASSSAASSVAPGLFRASRPNLFLPPQVARALGAGALLLGQAFLVAYRREKKRVASEEAEQDREAGGDGKGGTLAKPTMTPMEAVQLLGVEKVNPNIVNGSSSSSSASGGGGGISLPLTDPREREVARQNFERMFAIASKHNNMFLAGKLSAAYRLCVDPMWDQQQQQQTAAPEDDDDAEAALDRGGQQQQQQQQKSQRKD